MYTAGTTREQSRCLVFTHGCYASLNAHFQFMLGFDFFIFFFAWQFALYATANRLQCEHSTAPK